MDDVLAEAKHRWPGLTLAEPRFRALLAEGGVVDAIDLYLACGCAAGDPVAIASFDRELGGVIELAVAAAGAAPSDRADVRQIVRERLLVAPAAGGPPRIASYAGKGTLAAWVRVVATRCAIDMLAKVRREVSAEDDELAALLAPDDDPEIGYLKRLYRSEFKRAFEVALAALPDLDRLLLRQHTLDQLGIDALAKLHAVHRSTAARWLEAARLALLEGTQREMRTHLDLSEGELVSVIRMIRSGLDLSLVRLLG